MGLSIDDAKSIKSKKPRQISLAGRYIDYRGFGTSSISALSTSTSVISS
jgi:hypothetical protein